MEKIDMAVKSDAEIYQMAFEEWTSILVQLWTGIGKPVEIARLKIYQDQLKGIPLGLLEKAVDRVMRELTWTIVPPPGTIWEAIRKELGNPYNLSLELANWPRRHIGYKFTSEGVVPL